MTRKIIEIEIPVPEAADMAIKATAMGVSLAYYAGSLALLGAYGVCHPEVIEFRNRAITGISGPQIQEG